MSDQHRAKKDDERKDKANQRMHEQTTDEAQNVDRPDVRQPARDQFDDTLDKDSKRSERSNSNRV